MNILATLPPPPNPPGGSDLIGILPEIVLAAAFVVLMLLDLLVPPGRRNLLAGFSVLALLGALAATIFGWFDAGSGRTVYFGAFAYDRLGLFINGVLIVTAVLVVVISPTYLNRRGIHHGEYYALIVAATVGMMLLAGAASLMVIFLALELLSLALYILSGFARHEERSQEAAVKYLLLSSFASAFLLFGMALVYGETGHTQLEQISVALTKAGGGPDPLLIGGVVLIFVGFAFKVSAAPFHAWTPDVYQGAPTSVTTFMSVATKVAGFAVLIRVFDYTFHSLYSRWSAIVILVSIISMIVGNVAALTQTSLKRMLAYSGIAQAGYILIGVAILDPLATQGALYYLAAYAVTNVGAFAVITVMAGRGEDLDRYQNLRGLAFRRPYVAAAMGLFLLSLGGFPLTAGFFGKFFVFAAAIKFGNLPLALWGIGTSALSVFYYLRVALLMYTRPATEDDQYQWPRTSVAGSLVLAASTVGTVVLGVFVVLVLSMVSAAQAATLPPI